MRILLSCTKDCFLCKHKPFDNKCKQQLATEILKVFKWFLCSNYFTMPRV